MPLEARRQCWNWLNGISPLARDINPLSLHSQYFEVPYYHADVWGRCNTSRMLRFWCYLIKVNFCVECQVTNMASVQDLYLFFHLIVKFGVMGSYKFTLIFKCISSHLICHKNCKHGTKLRVISQFSYQKST